MPIQCKPMHCEGDLSSFKWKTHHKINTSLLMLREWTYTSERRDVLGNTSPEAREIARGQSRGPWQCTDILSALAGKYWFCGVTTDGASISKALLHVKELKFRNSGLHICITGIVSILPACKCLHWVYLHHCWNIVNVFRARMCSWYLP